MFNLPQFSTAAGLLLYAAEKHSENSHAPVISEKQTSVEEEVKPIATKQKQIGVKTIGFKKFFKKIIGNESYEEYAKQDTPLVDKLS